MAKIRPWHRHAWKLLLFLTLLLGLFGALDAISGAEVAAPINDAESIAVATTADIEARMAGRNLAFAALLLATIIVIPYRQAAPWAWWAMWSLPVWAISISLSYMLFIELPEGFARPPGADSGWIWFLVAGGTLLVDRARFFARSEVRPDAAAASRQPA